MMSTKRIVSIQGVLGDAKKLGPFFVALRGPKISEYLYGPVEVIPCKTGYEITVHIDSYEGITADVGRLLHFWKEFTIIEPD